MSFGPKTTLELQDLWSKSFYGLKTLSIKTSALIFVPFPNQIYSFTLLIPSSTNKPPGILDSNS
jgi:hypothetical protein